MVGSSDITASVVTAVVALGAAAIGIYGLAQPLLGDASALRSTP